jgi:hypothetical protein
LPEVAEYQVKIREKSRKEREARISNADFTRYDVQIDGEQYSSVPKRKAIFLICKRLCERGVHPNEIAALVDRHPNRVWYSVKGNVDTLKFEELASSSNGSSFQRDKWFCEDGQLIQGNEMTYAFSNQWGGEKWFKTMNRLKEKYQQQFNIDFSPAS